MYAFGIQAQPTQTVLINFNLKHATKVAFSLSLFITIDRCTSILVCGF
jgi:hypothetical protein